MPLSDIMHQDVKWVESKSSILDAARLMKTQHVGDLIVVDRRFGVLRPIGVLTDRDIVTFIVADGLDPSTIEVGDVMATDPETAYVGDGVFEVCRQMSESGVRRLPVVDERGNLKGIVSIDDIYQLLSVELSNLAAVPEAQIRREVTGEAFVERF